jgi:dihydropyrimidine dehydrogenase (NAD+) subunit PreA
VKTVPVPVITTIRNPGEWQELAGTVQDAGADAIELKVSCPYGMPERGVGRVIGRDESPGLSLSIATRNIFIILSPNEDS